MLRTIISKIRLLLLGPVLNRFSRLTPGQVESMMMLASDGSVMKPASSRQQASTSADGTIPSEFSSELDRLRKKVAELSERIDVLERVYKK